MECPAVKIDTGEMTLRAAEVKVCSEGEYVVFLEHRPLRARRAAGCLLEPEAGDVVLTAATPSGAVFVLSVLTRGTGGKEGRVSVPNAAMTLSGECLRLRPSRELTVVTPQLSLDAETGRVNIDACAVQGGSLENRFRKITTVAWAIETVCERFVARLERSYRLIRDFEETRSGRMRTIVTGLFHLAAGNANVQAEKRLKMNAEKIHLG